MGYRSYIIFGVALFIFVIIYIDNFTEGFEASHLENYYPEYYDTTPDYTRDDIHFAKRLTTPVGTTSPAGTTSPVGTTSPAGTAYPTSYNQ